MQILIILKSKNFGIEVKKRLLDIGMRQIELAGKVGVSEALISEILNGKKKAFNTRKKIVAVIEENNIN